jgi:hypothetical protein
MQLEQPVDRLRVGRRDTKGVQYWGSTDIQGSFLTMEATSVHNVLGCKAPVWGSHWNRVPSRH